MAPKSSPSVEVRFFTDGLESWKLGRDEPKEKMYIKAFSNQN